MIFYTDRLRTEVDWNCPQASYWLTEHGGDTDA